MAKSYIGLMRCLPLGKLSMRRSLWIETFNFLYLQHVCDRLKACFKKNKQTKKHHKEGKISQYISSEKISQKQNKMTRKGQFLKPMGVIRKTSRSSKCNVTKFDILREHTNKQTHSLSPAIKQSKKQGLAPENSSNTMKGSKYLSSNLINPT